MTRVDGTTISMTRGDTFRAIITLTDENGEIYIPSETDRIVFTVKANYESDVLIQKDVPLDTLTLELAPDDTKQLDMPKTYVYDIQLITEDGNVDTFISKSKLKIYEEVG